MPHASVSDRLRGRAKRLRREATPAETLLWRHIKAHRVEGFGFRRQVPFKNYIADFVCMSARLIIELDGFSHDSESQQRADRERDAFFVSHGFRVLRFSNRDVLSNLAGVVESVREALQVATPLPTPPPQGGREQAVRGDTE